MAEDGAEVAADTDRHGYTLALAALGGYARLHHHRGAHRVIHRGESGHNLVADGLDHGPVVVVRGVLHDIEAQRDGLARLGIAEFVVQLGAADDISKEYCDFQVLRHLNL